MRISDWSSDVCSSDLDIGVLVGLARLDVTDGHAVELGPLHEGFAQELRAVVGAQALRQAVVGLELFEDADQARGRDRGIDLNVQRLAVEVDDHVAGADAAAAGKSTSPANRSNNGV